MVNSTITVVEDVVVSCNISFSCDGLLVCELKVTFDLEELGDGEISPMVPVDCLELDYLFVKKEVDCEMAYSGVVIQRLYLFPRVLCSGKIA
ncbi:hypothetical protein L484_024172 [Morus notabilis]|uniref:Uncharacterized protein n=1 Tax=Morus notabilis TaxID=981085 RepID=W9RLY3_9ROSA|nr:hypothetical protein L484_024172 [Morus notabilis]